MISIKISKELDAADGILNLRVNMNINKGELVAVYGESGVGKTSTLRMLAGLLKPDSGTINVDGATWYDGKKKVNLKPQLRNVGLVFQDYALFPHMTIWQNLEYALSKTADKSVIGVLIEIMELENLKDRYPNTLSGGQQQRVALARALIQQPKILLLDEPLAALDYKIRIKLQDYILKVHQDFDLTTLIISHDVGEIIKLADRVVVLKNGLIDKIGNPIDVLVNQQISGKFRFTGEVLYIEKQEVVYIVSVLIQSNVVKVIAQESEVSTLSIGSKVVVVSKAFNPLIYSIE